MKYASLFSGIGGFDLGFDRAGMTSVLQVENNRDCRAVLARHWPHVRRIGDVHDVSSADLDGIDLLCGGFPCQDLSLAGKRAGLAGDRSGLWFEFHRLLTLARPAWVVIENVPGLLSSNKGRDFGVIVDSLVECGYGVAWRVLDSQGFGVPQRRRRVFIVGHLGDDRAGAVLLDGDSGAWDRPPRRRTGEVAAALAGGHAGGAWRDGGDLADTLDVPLLLDARNGAIDEDVSQTLQSKESGSYSLNAMPILVGAISMAIRTRDGISSLEVGDELANALLTSNGGRGGIGSGAILQAFDWSASASQYRGATPVRAGDYAQMRANGHDAVAGWGFRPRRLMPVECERLQGFPDGWTAGHKDTPRYRMLGNAISVPVAEWIGRRILAAD